MNRLGRKRAARIAQLAAVAAALPAAALAGCGGGGGSTASTQATPSQPPPTTSSQPGHTTTGTAPNRGGHPSGPTPAREARRAVARYVTALDARDGDRLCSLFAPGALDDLKLPVQGDGCADSLAASLGYRDPRGFPVWRHSQVRRFRSVVVRGEAARVTVTVETRYADRRQPSIEDDVVYLERQDDRWLLAKPSVTIYRAIGVPNAPPQVLAPP